MAEARRVRLETHIEDYLLSQAERVLGKPAEKVTGAELTTITNAICYEHKLAQQMAKRVPFAKLFNWLISLTPGVGRVVQIAPDPVIAPSPQEDFEFDAAFADQFDEAA